VGDGHVAPATSIEVAGELIIKTGRGSATTRGAPSTLHAEIPEWERDRSGERQSSRV